MGYVQDAVGPSVPPPGWTPIDTPQAPVPGPAAVGGADAAVRWRISAGLIDNILVNCLYGVLCAVLGWSVGSLDHLWLVVVLDVAYHFAYEAHSGQTIGKRQYGLRVVAADGGRADARAIAIRSVLRIVDMLPTCYVSGLVSMMRTGSARRQRIGDVAAQTTVVAVEGRALGRGTPGWVLPCVTIVALFMSAISIFGIARSDNRPLTAADRAAFMTGCERDGMVSSATCECILARLEVEGYNTAGAARALAEHAQEDAASGRLSPDSRDLLAAVNTCRPSPPPALGPLD
jgi:uncharacterized RDD family membrane protein YckC